MNIQHEIVSFNAETGSLLVRYYSSEVPDGLVYNIDVPIEDGAFIGQSEVDNLIEHMKPVGQLERIAAVKVIQVPEHLQAYVPVVETETVNQNEVTL